MNRDLYKIKTAMLGFDLGQSGNQPLPGSETKEIALGGGGLETARFFADTKQHLDLEL